MAKGDDGDKNAGTYGWYPAGGVAVGLLIGTWLDRKYGWHGHAAITGAVIGMIAGLYLLIKEGMKSGK